MFVSVSHFQPSLIFEVKANACPGGAYNKLERCVTLSHLNPSLIFVGKAGAYFGRAFNGYPLLG